MLEPDDSECVRPTFQPATGSSVGNSPVRLEIQVGPLRPEREHLANQADLEVHRRLWFAGKRGRLARLYPTAVVAGGQDDWPDGTQPTYPTDAVTAPHQVSQPYRPYF
jgi:hypothetical protein